MRLKKGFTLIELLAVIVILAIIALIAMPAILKLIEEARKSAFKNTAYGIVRAAEIECSKSKLYNGVSERKVIFKDYEMGTEKINFSGKGPKSGKVYIADNCQVSIAIHNGKWCAKKDAEKKEVIVSEIAESICDIETELGLNQDMLKCLINNECDGIILPDDYIGTEGQWLPISSRQDLENITSDGPANNMIFGAGTAYEKIWNDSGYAGLNGRFEQKYIVVKDFNIGADDFVSIGQKNRPFCGIFDGNYNAIDGLTSTVGGLFGDIFPTDGAFSECIVRNVNLTNVDINTTGAAGGISRQINSTIVKNVSVEGKITAENNVGGLIGQAYTAVINSSNFEGSIEGDKYVGGLIGFFGRWKNMAGELLENSYAKVDVKGNQNVGGLIGEAHIDEIRNVYTEGSVVGGNSAVGGLIGHYSGGYSMENVYTKTHVEGDENVGGLVGELYIDVIKNAYTEGNVVGGNNVGGLIGYAVTQTMENLHTTGSVNGVNYVGGLFGQVYFETIRNSYSTGNITSGVSGKYTGGFAGFMGGEFINDCYTKGAVAGEDSVGGFANGYANATRIYSTGNVTGRDNVGSLLGKVHYISEIDNSYATGNVSGRNNVGGFIGLGGEANITNSYVINDVIGTGSYVGGFIGKLDSDQLHYVYAVNNTLSGISNVGGLIGGLANNIPEADVDASTYSYWDTTVSNVSTNTAVSSSTEIAGRITNQMKQQSNYTNWDFTNTWIISDGHYPKLRWQN